MSDDLGPNDLPEIPDDDADPSHDDALVNALRSALPPDLPPPGLTDRAKALVTLFDLDRDLAELLESAAVEPVGMRGTTVAGEQLTFRLRGGDVVVETEVRSGALTGVVVLGDVAQVVLDSEHGEVAIADVDDAGRFAFPRVASRVVRLRLRLLREAGDTGRAPVTSDWFLLQNPGAS
jgi:hypothetical protein